MFKCFQCSTCCRNLEILNIERKKMIAFAEDQEIDKKIITKFRYSLIYITGATKRDYYFLDGPCPFSEKGKCLIYEMRPMVCRNFQCGRLNEKEELTWKGNRCLNTELHQRIEPEFKKQCIENVAASERWARKNGII